MAGAVTEPAVAAISVCRSLKDQFKQALREIPAQQARELAKLPKALCFAIDAIKDSIHQASRLMHMLVHMRRILWLKNLSAKAPCKNLLTGFSFHGERLFVEELDKYIQTISSEKSTLLPVNRKYKHPSFKRALSPTPGASASRQWRQPPLSDSRGKSQSQTQAQKKSWEFQGDGPQAVCEQMKQIKSEGAQHRKLNLEDLHILCQWQCCLQMVLSLNHLLCTPLLVPDLTRLYNGSLVYCLVQKLKTLSIAEDIFKPCPPLEILYRDCFGAVMSAVPQDCFQSRSKSASKKSKKNSKSGKTSANMPNKTENPPQSNISNRFAALYLED
ncbi:hypothetical protein AB205_0191260 [Aquarana catesbeiana]|uniref:Uncharacterized protein n=1 Tax=Aquarana catesbeiana TaxID=8400 RepID=A0A2G9PJS5_AQUCT|nr:hypothetical protein AB205_0191260 [Aquarana catesbeiana]